MAATLFNPAQFVGDVFAKQYYAMLQQSPELVHRFYKDMSEIGRVDTDEGLMSSTTTMKAIDEKIQSYGSLKADIKFVDAQESYRDGVIVLVYGSMVNEDDSRRNFTQTFFLAPQANGYYVLNDIFRYVNDDDLDSNEQHGGLSPVTSDQESPPIEENRISEQSNGEVYNLSGELPVEVVKEEFQVEEKFEEEEPVAVVVDESPQESGLVVESSALVEGTSKKSYASIVMKDAPATMSSSTPPKSVLKIQDRQFPVLPAPNSVSVPPSSKAEAVEDVNNHDPEGGGHFIYVRNLPVNMPSSVVEQVFQEFGPIRSNGIQIRRSRAPIRQGQHAFCFGFVEFETAAAAQNAIEASPIFIEGHKVEVEEKKSTATRGYSYGGNNRGRYHSGGRGGSGFQGEGGRGRGGYEGGRGHGGRWDGNKSEFRNRGGGGDGRGYQTRNEGFQRSDKTGNGSGLMNRGRGSSHMLTRPLKVSA
ncbi:hypothetical protein KSS87_009258 [Heliosperma pusillum]|nr:hypothetical protein KSS87_009258 [Heliosperma pusillum]